MLRYLFKIQFLKSFFYNNLIFKSQNTNHKWLTDKSFFKTLGKIIRVNDLQKKHQFYFEELINNESLEKYWNSKINKHKIFHNKVNEDNRNFKSILLDFLKYRVFFCYTLVRLIKPKNILETGVAAGISSSLILAALKKNNCGKLISIDLPPSLGMKEYKTLDKNVGILVPENFKQYWTFKKGDSKKLLGQLLLKNNPEIFIHDSLHEYKHMLFEYVNSWMIMKKKSFILTDDLMLGVKGNKKAWFDFLKLSDLKGLSFIKNENFGLTIIK